MNDEQLEAAVPPRSRWKWRESFGTARGTFVSAQTNDSEFAISPVGLAVYEVSGLVSSASRAEILEHADRTDAPPPRLAFKPYPGCGEKHDGAGPCGKCEHTIYCLTKSDDVYQQARREAAAKRPAPPRDIYEPAPNGAGALVGRFRYSSR